MRTMRAAPCRSSRRPSAAVNSGPSVRLADRQVDRPGGARRQRDGHHLPALAGDHQGAVPALEAQVLDVRPVASDTRERCPQRTPRDDDELHHDP
jgi:hypothetical protein